LESSEHVEVGNAVLLDLGSGSPAAAASIDLGVATMPLTYGEIVALGGDFYGTPDLEPISSHQPEGAIDAARDAWGTLENASQDQLARIMAILRKEQEAIAEAKGKGEQPSSAYRALGDSLSYEWNEATGGAPAAEGKVGAALKPGRYLRLAVVNMDHFGYDALKAYMAVHSFALSEAAKQTGQDLTTAGAQKSLKRAYAINAFGDHFLTDLFAAGHLRTPRRALYEMTTTSPGESGLLARVMHNEDNQSGLHVSNQAGSWLAFGDGRELDQVNSANFAMAVRAVQASADEVLQVAKTGRLPDTHQALLLTPWLDGFRPKPVPGGANNAPLFWADPEDYVYRRGGAGGHWHDPTNFDYTYVWSALGMATHEIIQDLLLTT
jgi:hypothetical protein